MTKALRLIGYTRVSTSEQARSGLGAGAQRRRITEAVERDGHQLVEVIADDGESGKTLSRPGLRRALEAIAAGEADGLVVAKLDRVSRSVIDFASLLEWFIDAKAHLVILDPAMDTSTAAGRLVANVFASVAAWEAEVIAERTIDALATKRAAGEQVGRPAVVDDPKLAKRIRALRAKGVSLRGIAAQLDADGVPTVRGGEHWQVSAVQSVLGYKRPRPRRTDLPDPRPRRRGHQAA